MKDAKAKKLKPLLLAMLLLSLTACSLQADEPSQKQDLSTVKEDSSNTALPNVEKHSLIREEGKTVTDRFLLPDGYERTDAAEGTFGHYLRNLPLKAVGERVRYFDGREKASDVYDGVVDMDIGSRDLQQCADAVMRLRGEFLYQSGKYDKIHFNLTNGFRVDFSKWAQGNRVVVDNNKTYWAKKAGNSSSYESFRKYMEFVFAYAGTLSLERELKKVELAEMEIGDVFIKGGSPGHCVIVVDMAENKEEGKKLFMLAQSYMPAQDTQILKNEGDESLSPWYPLDFKGDLQTPEWTFSADTLKRFED